jgi:hypothetical protein
MSFFKKIRKSRVPPSNPDKANREIYAARQEPYSACLPAVSGSFRMLQRTVGNRAVQRLLHAQAKPPVDADAVSSVGDPLAPPMRHFMEGRMGHGLDGVRVHTDRRAAASADALNARAYTLGQDIVFGTGQFAPHTAIGRRLLAHELTHALQQRRTISDRQRPAIIAADHPMEHQADRVAGQVAGGQAIAPVQPLISTTPVVMRDENTEPTQAQAEKPETEVAFGSPAWPWLVIEPLLVKLPQRWQAAIKAAEASGEYALFDIRLGRKLVYNQLAAFQNLFYANVFTGLSAYKPEFGKGLEIAEGLSGVEDTYINLISLALRVDLKKYLEDDLPDIVQANLGWAIIYGLLVQGGLVGLNVAMEEDLNFTSLITPALKKYTEAPLGFTRAYQLPNIPDPRWKAYPFLQSPSGVEFKLSDVYEEEKPYTLSLDVGFNIASMADLYPEDEAQKKKYTGFELYPYFSFGHIWPKEGQSVPPTQNRWLAGVFFGNHGVYTLLEGGQRFGPGGERHAGQQDLATHRRGPHWRAFT